MTPAMWRQQQGNNSNMSVPASAVLPPVITNEAVQEIYKKYLQMKAQGVSQSDPELMRALGILRGIQQKTELLKRE
jgi:ATP-dependent helicase STH1/SNF2